MKTCLKSLSLLALASSFPCIALAEMAGARLPVAVTAENAVAVFAMVSVGVILSFDYRGSARRAAMVARMARPAATRESHRLAA
jgi:hypothetical protein